MSIAYANVMYLIFVAYLRNGSDFLLDLPNLYLLKFITKTPAPSFINALLKLLPF